ncbi:hypothetical protein TCON_1610 [Astathelohania contejeani]|uniref:THUMP domain-containing protein n=1 Tax=Astathelohania contejeani TaxID=164912 RepID=A0ABQ7HYD9_9MICR|nr:hypothetical protein TCON_1610 [Thelohania contejeani]
MKSGFLISCNRGRDKQARTEALRLLYLTIVNTNDNNKDLAIEDSIKNEKEHLTKLFSYTSLKKIKSLFLIENKSDIIPTEIYTRLRDLNLCTKEVHRIIPLNKITSHNYKDMILSLCYELNKTTSMTYKILFEYRLCDKKIKEEIFEIITSTVELKVCLDNPDYIFIVEVMKKHVGASIIKNDGSNFNFRISK